MASTAVSPRALLMRLVLYYAVVLGGTWSLVTAFPATRPYLPVGGDPELSVTERLAVSGASAVGLTLMTYLIGAVLATLPISWVYMTTHRATGFQANFVRALVILPIVATSTVLLVKDSLSLAFGLAALVAAVRFRISLADPLDGVYVLASIAVGLGAGIGYVGVAFVTTAFFTLGATTLWMLDYGRYPVAEHGGASEQLETSGSPTRLDQSS